jgi:tyrosinase
MRSSILSIIFAVAAGVAALPQSVPTTPLAPALPIEQFENKQQFQRARLLTLEDVLAGAHKVNTTETPQEPEFNAFPDDMSISATCSNPRVRQEWDSYSDGDRQAFISAIRCLQNRPSSGQFSQSKTRYEDLVALHQTLTPNIHSQLDRPNAKFLIWHRYYLWAFEDILRSECGFDRNMPWFDETRYAGRFTQSSIFSSRWFGSANVNGNCVTDGVSIENSIAELQLTIRSNSQTWPSMLVLGLIISCIVFPATTTTASQLK